MPETHHAWAHTLLDANPTWKTIRLGHGFDVPTGVSTAWVDIITRDGRHLAASQDHTLPEIPMSVHHHITSHLHLGGWIEITR
jgi:hypothetical protein